MPADIPQEDDTRDTLEWVFDCFKCVCENERSCVPHHLTQPGASYLPLSLLYLQQPNATR